MMSLLLVLLVLACFPNLLVLLGTIGQGTLVDHSDDDDGFDDARPVYMSVPGLLKTLQHSEIWRALLGVSLQPCSCGR